MDIQASAEDINFSQAKEAMEAIQLQHPLVYDQYEFLCHGDRRDSKEPKAFYATARVRRPGTTYTSPTHTQKGSILGASGGHHKQMHVPEVTLNNCHL